MPNRCYGSDLEHGTYPAEQKIDFEVKWNLRLTGTFNYRADQFDEQSEVNSLLCSYGALT